MASRPKRKFVTSRERGIFLQQFYDNIEENEELFLGYSFVGNEHSDSEFVQSSDSGVQIITKKGGILRMTQKIYMVIILPFESRKNCQDNKS